MRRFYCKFFVPIIMGLLLFLYACSNGSVESNLIPLIIDQLPSIKGKKAYLSSPMVTAGNRVYMVGHQDGSFPPLGWHITGEMGGIWDHPIKLMDGFEVTVENSKTGEIYKLDQAKEFINYPMANEHIFEYNELQVQRIQFVPDDEEGLIVQFIIKNKTSEKAVLRFKFTGMVDLRSTWLGERTNMVDGIDIPVYNRDIDAWVAKDSLNSWFTIFGADVKSTGHFISKTDNPGKGVSPSLEYLMDISPDAEFTITVAVTGSYTSEVSAKNTYLTILTQWKDKFKEKQMRYGTLADRSKLTTPDKDLDTTFEWLKYNADWLIREIPELGTAIGAGIPDYPWLFGVDSEYALKGYLAVGQYDIVYKTIAMLDSVSRIENGNGRIIHEMSTNGAVFNPGNINETPQFVSLIRYVYDWTGDESFLRKYFPSIKDGLKWLVEENDANKNLFPDGFGMMEIHGMDSEMIDVASYSQKAFADAAYLANKLDENDLSSEYLIISEQLRSAINDQFWSEEYQSYADFIGSDAQAAKLISDAIIRADTLNKPWAVNELKMTREKLIYNPSRKPRPWVLHHNWVVNTPMEVALADPEKAIKALKTAEKFVNPFGVFVTGIDRDESAGSDEGSFKGSKAFSYTGAVMTLPTGVQAIAENNYGRPDQALDYLNRMVRSFSYALPGSMYEVSPDYGMITQAWNIYAFAIPIVGQFFGINPRASQKEIEIAIQMPTAWNVASLENVKVDDNYISVFYKRDGDSTHVSITQTNPQWKIRSSFPATRSNDIKLLQGEMSEDENSLIILTSKKTGLEWKMADK